MAKRKLAVVANVPQLSQAVREITAERAGAMSDAERQDLHELLAVTAAAISEDDARKAEAVQSAEAGRVAKRHRVATASKDAGARLGAGVLQRLPGGVAAKLLAFCCAEDFRSLAQIKCCRSDASAGVLRAGVRIACEAIAPYTDPPQLMLGSAWQPLAVLEDAMARADSFYAATPRRPWYSLLRVRPLVGHEETQQHAVDVALDREGLRDFDSEAEGVQVCTPFQMDMASYCGLDDCPVTAPRPRCERDATVAAAVVEILRRVPDKFARHARDWLEQWLKKVLEGDSSLAMSHLDDEVVVPSQTRLWLLSAAGFAPALTAAFESARKIATVNALAKGFLAVRSNGHMESVLAAERAHLYQWRDAARAALGALLSCTTKTDGGFRDMQCRLLWRFLHRFCNGAKRVHIYLLQPDVMWNTILEWDLYTPIIAWGVNQMSEPASINQRTVDLVSHVMRHLARHVPAAARRILSLGALEACERVLDNDVRFGKSFTR